MSERIQGWFLGIRVFFAMLMASIWAIPDYMRYRRLRQM